MDISRNFKRVRTLCGAVLALTGFLAAAETTDVQRTLNGIEKRYNNATTLQVNFTETYIKPRAPKKTEKGVLYSRKQNKMRWEYTSPAGKLYGSDGKFTYEKDENGQIEKTPLKETDDARAPLAFLLGKVDFDKYFGMYETDANGLITAFPKSDKFPYTQVSFLTGPDFAIQKLSVKLIDNSVIEYIFDGEKINPPLADSLFRFPNP